MTHDPAVRQCKRPIGKVVTGIRTSAGMLLRIVYRE
jgi:DNA-directed RNA polymerase subunit H (RpoH/RPB5)